MKNPDATRKIMKKSKNEIPALALFVLFCSAITQVIDKKKEAIAIPITLVEFFFIVCHFVNPISFLT